METQLWEGYLDGYAYVGHYMFSVVCRGIVQSEHVHIRVSKRIALGAVNENGYEANLACWRPQKGRGTGKEVQDILKERRPRKEDPSGE